MITWNDLLLPVVLIIGALSVLVILMGGFIFLVPHKERSKKH